MRKILNKIKLLFILIILMFGISNLTTVMSLDFSEQKAMYDTLVSNKEQSRFEVETAYKFSNLSAEITSNDVYVFNDDYSYYLKDCLQSSPSMDFFERLVIHGVGGDEYYSRVRNYIYSAPDHMGIVPYIQTDNSQISDTIMSYLDNPIFFLDLYFTDSVLGFDVNVSDLTPEHKAYIEKDIQTHLPGSVLSESGKITFYMSYNDEGIYRIRITYGSMFEGIYSVTQTIDISSDNTIDTVSALSNKLDFRGVSTLSGTSFPSIEIGETVQFVNDYRSEYGQYAFIEVTEAKEFVFAVSDDNANLEPQWYVYDLEMNQYKSRLDLDEYTYYFKSHDVSIYLEPGIYYIFLCPRTINMNNASITLENRNELDDYSNCFNPENSVISENTALSFTTDYEYDYDVFSVDGDYDYVVVEDVEGVGLAIERNLNIEFSQLSNTYIIEMPKEGPLSLYFSGIELAAHHPSIRFYSYTEDVIPFSEAEFVDIYNLSSSQVRNGILSLPFSGGKARYSFEIKSDSKLYTRALYSQIEIYNSELNLVECSAEGYYNLQAGDYYLELNEFTNAFTNFWLTPEIPGEDIIVLSPEDSVYRIIGHIDNGYDADIFQMTIDEDSVIQFDNFNAMNVLIYGADNPNLYIFDARIKMPFFIQAGTYYITLPADFYFMDSYDYNFTMTIIPFEEETDVTLSYSEVVNGDGVTTYQFTPSFDYFGDEESITLDVSAGDVINFTYSTIINKAILTYTTSNGVTSTTYIYSYNTSQFEGNFMTFNQDGTITILFGVYDNVNSFLIGSSGEMLIEINVWDQE